MSVPFGTSTGQDLGEGVARVKSGNAFPQDPKKKQWHELVLPQNNLQVCWFVALLFNGTEHY